ncbi:archaellin/type IV pilin N-terminal domain-containing protein [Haloarchaeobius sp. FL176]|uniref:archaellin/type IV pilin N-terminal domain-containing protein n=1 Tax=Haloarchaeobius sp. FL176 TaxID=2967129 RepID=UPI0021476F7A|nr:archaellin/type IV pilin N-terminal domain-containing protein [Haloarchaeobius sp. FL176]
MIVDVTENDERGQVGIGTLIIFIAMVLVAAVAAGVLINTAGLLESTASDTGQDSQAQVSNQIDVVTATGHNVDGDSAVEILNFTVKKSAGSGNLDLEDATLEYQSDTASQTLSYGATANSTHFNHSVLKGDSNAVLEETNERINTRINVTDVDSELVEGSEATVRFVDQSGATTIYGVNVPDSISGETFVEV